MDFFYDRHHKNDEKYLQYLCNLHNLGRMFTMRVSDLITDPLLRLELATPSARTELEARIASAVATESIDPAAYLSPGTLVLTTGMALNFDDPRIWDGYVERLINAEVAALAFGLGKPHTSVPRGLMESARRAGLPVLAVPSEVPFLHLQNLVHRALAEEDFQASRLGWSIAEECTGMAAHGLELDSVLEHVAARANIELRIVDDAGAVFAVGGQKPEPDGCTAQPGLQEPVLSLPLPLDDDAKWNLLCFASTGTTSDSQLRTILSPAAAVLSMVVSRILGSTMWVSEESAELLTALERTDEAAIPNLEAVLRRVGIDLSDGARLISVRSRGSMRLHLLAWRLMRLFSETDLVTPMETSTSVLLLLTPSTEVAGAVGRSRVPFSQLIEEIAALTGDGGDSVFVSEPLRSARALCFFTAVHGARRSGVIPDPGVHLVGAPQLEDVISLIPPMYSAAISESLLGPVLSSGRSSELLKSLAVFIDTTSITEAAFRLKIHRNTARAHRVELEERLGVDLNRGADRSMCALALAGLDR